MGKALTVKDIALMCDHSLLRPNLTDEEFIEGIEIVQKYKCKTVMVAPYDVPKAVSLLEDSPVEVSTVIDFPHGLNQTEIKVFQAVKALDNGARHLDMVLATSRALSGHYDYVERDIASVAEVAHARGVLLKVIFEICYLTDEMIVACCHAAERAGADFVKTSTGYGPGGATLDGVRLMRNSVSSRLQVKAAGGIRNLDQVLEYRKAGASMIGTRSTGVILDEAVIREKGSRLQELD